jgi:hypothetical protein
LTIATVQAATGESDMRHSETHFEQIPIEVVLSIIQQAMALDSPPKDSPAPVPAPEPQVAREFPKTQEGIPTKGRL